MSREEMFLNELRLSKAMMRLIADWRICFKTVDNRTAQALKDRGLAEFGSAFGFLPKWTLTEKGLRAKAYLALFPNLYMDVP